MRDYQVFKGSFYVITNKSAEEDVTINDKVTGVCLATIPAGSQGLIMAIGKTITAGAEVIVTLVR